MRVVAGERKGMPLKVVDGNTTRPTIDKVKESIFSMIGPFFQGGIAVDLFAGSGGLGIETLSRGADQAIFVEKDNRAYSVLKENIKKCRYEDVTEVYRNDATRAVKALLKRDIKIDYLFLDPPYHKTEYYDLVTALVEGDKLAEDAIILCEHDKKVKLPESYGPYTCVRQELYSSTIISIYRNIGDEA